VKPFTLTLVNLLPAPTVDVEKVTLDFVLNNLLPRIDLRPTDDPDAVTLEIAPFFKGDQGPPPTQDQIVAAIQTSAIDLCDSAGVKQATIYGVIAP
jgi:hypothetical protein